MSRVVLVWFLAIVLTGCGVDIDLWGLRFQPEGAEETRPDTTDVVESEGIPCAYFYHCLLDTLDEGGKPSECLGQVDPGEAVLVGAVENCRKNACVKQDQIPGSPTFSPVSFMDCVMSSCWAEVGQCAPGHGDKSCKDFAAEYKAYLDGEETCDEVAPELCVLEALYPVTASQTAAVDLLLSCIFTEYSFGQPYQTCVSKCNLTQ
jgi:hypothetical protein